MTSVILLRGSNSMRRHQESVAHIAVRVQHFSLHQNPFRIYHGSTNSTRPSKKRLDQMVDTTSLSSILKVDTDTNTALVEPNVPMDKLVEATLQYGLIPPVVMEFPGITAGGGFAGTSGESSSFRHGFFDFENTHVFRKFEIPSITTCSRICAILRFYCDTVCIPRQLRFKSTEHSSRSLPSPNNPTF